MRTNIISRQVEDSRLEQENTPLNSPIALNNSPGRLARISATLLLAGLISGCNGGGGTLAGSGGSTASGSGSGAVIGNPGSGIADSPGSGGAPPSGGDSDVVPGGGFDDGSGGGGGSSGGGGGGNGGTVTNSISITVPDTGAGVTGRSSTEVNTNVTGNFLALDLNVSNANAFQIVSQNGSKLLASVYLLDPQSNQLLTPADFRKTTGLCTIRPSDNCLDTGINVLPYRAAPDDDGVADGTYQQTLFSEPGTVTSTVIAKNDPNLAGGVLRVNIFLVGGDAQDPDFKGTVLPAAMAIWRSIYAQIGITLADQTFDVGSTFGVLPLPLVPASLYANAQQQGGVQSLALNVFIGTSISSDGTENPGNELDGALGIAAAVPGAGIVTGRSAVAVSIAGHTGASGQFDSSDKITIFAETLAHEGGHYLGLFHPVETDFETFDILSDTPECTTVSGCISAGAASNVMFPFPVEGAGDPHVAQQSVTGLQGQVLNFQTIVD